MGPGEVTRSRLFSSDKTLREAVKAFGFEVQSWHFRWLEYCFVVLCAKLKKDISKI